MWRGGEPSQNGRSRTRQAEAGVGGDRQLLYSAGWMLHPNLWWPPCHPCPHRPNRPRCAGGGVMAHMPTERREALEALATVEAEFDQVSQERDRLRTRTHEIQEAADRLRKAPRPMLAALQSWAENADESD